MTHHSTLTDINSHHNVSCITICPDILSDLLTYYPGTNYDLHPILRASVLYRLNRGLHRIPTNSKKAAHPYDFWSQLALVYRSAMNLLELLSHQAISKIAVYIGAIYPICLKLRPHRFSSAVSIMFVCARFGRPHKDVAKVRVEPS